MLFLVALLIGVIVIFVGIRIKHKTHTKTSRPIDPSIIYIIDEQLIEGRCDLVGSAFDHLIEICQKIDQAPKDQPIKLILSTGGGKIALCLILLKKLKTHPTGYLAYIHHGCFSAGTILALGATTIYMNNDSYLGKIDPQITTAIKGLNYPAIIYRDLPTNCITDQTIAPIRLSQQALNQIEGVLDVIFCSDSIVKDNVRQQMIYSQLPHDQPFDRETCTKMGLPVQFWKENTPCPISLHKTMF